MNNRNYGVGLVLIAIGVIGILNQVFNINIFSIVNIWPLIIITIGLCLEGSYFLKKKSPGVLVPGGILTTLGILFIFESATNWRFSGYTWPFYFLAVAIGLFQLYIFGSRERGLLIPIGILLTIFIVSFGNILLGTVFGWLNKSLIVPIIFIIIGVFVIFEKKD